MTNYERIYEFAADNYGLITSAQAKSIGIPNIELVKLAQRGRLERIGHGLYRIRHYTPTPLDQYAEAVMFVGPDAFIFGESVLAMLGLALVNPTVITVATPTTVRKKLPEHIEAIRVQKARNVVQHDGIPMQNLADAIRTCRSSVMTERLLDSVEDARIQGFITAKETEQLKKELRNGK
jgi:predicted transcriptional regulator of viral defense system